MPRLSWWRLVVALILRGSFILSLAFSASAATVNFNAHDLIPKAAIFLSPAEESVLEGATFNVSVYLNTEQASANTLDLTIQFPPNAMQIVSPSAGTSLLQVWLQPPSYSNINGTAHFTGVIPNGIVTQGGLITTITFKALTPGAANITISPDSSVLANDGYGTKMNVEFGRATVTVNPKPPEGIAVYSTTHEFPSQWYNNPNPAFDWTIDPGVTAQSYLLDNNPNTIPNDTPKPSGTQASYQNLGDGLWYFHIKVQKNGIWGTTTHAPVRIDTTPPAAFTPVAELYNQKILTSFFTTDALSGIDHYEVAVIDPLTPNVASPVFTQTESPYALAAGAPGTYRIIVRAFDRAGNTLEETATMTISTPLIQTLKEHDLAIMTGLLLFVIFLFILHYFWGHRLIRRVHRMIIAAEHEAELEDQEERQG